MARAREYFELRTEGGTSYITYNSVEKLTDLAGIVLDCDGILIDESTSYDEAIKMAVSKIVGIVTGYTIDPELVSSNIIYTLRGIGSFNNDWDTTYLLSVILSSWIASDKGDRLHERLERVKAGDFSLEPTQQIDSGLQEALRNRVRELDIVLGQLEMSALPVKDVLDKVLHSQYSGLRSRIDDCLGYPGEYGRSLVVTVFDEVYFGSDNIRNIRRAGPFFSYRGKINDERLLVDEDTLRKLKEHWGRLALSTGRGSWETYKTLGRLVDYLDSNACVFIGDLVASNPSQKMLYEKPSPWPLQKAASSLSMDGRILYVGNSVEDLLMFENANRIENRYLFAGVYSGVKALEMLEVWIERGVDMAIPSVNLLPKVLQHLSGE
jgi:phosphoglycolate phosphatase-like HAD superfamily hydrolase